MIPAAVISDPDYRHLKERLIEFSGLAYYEDKDKELAERIAGRLSELGVRSCASYLDLLQADGKGEAELDLLIGELTIGETYFFRHREQFDALRSIVVPEILERNQNRRRIHIWSAGCATGAEPYSIAVLLQEDFCAQLTGWDVHILGTDINRRFLSRACEGRFEDWAFRSVSDDFKQRHFRRAGKSWLIAPEYKPRVSFQYHNLVKHAFPSLVNNLSAFDLILCRNVMIYFSSAVARPIVANFHECLVEGGWLVVGHAEPNAELFHDFHVVSAPGTTLYQRRPEPALPVAPAGLWAGAPFTAVDIEAPEAPGPDGVARPSAPVSSSSVAEPADLLQVRLLADRGQWESAAELCRALLEKNGLDPAIHFYYALVLEQMGLAGDAEQSLRRAIYLDRKFVLAHYHLGLFLQKTRPQTAARSFENVLRLLSPHDGDFKFSHGDGITAAELRELTKMHLEVLRA